MASVICSRQALLIFGGNIRRIFFGREQKRIGVDDALALHREFFRAESERA